MFSLFSDDFDCAQGSKVARANSPLFCLHAANIERWALLILVLLPLVFLSFESALYLTERLAEIYQASDVNSHRARNSHCKKLFCSMTIVSGVGAVIFFSRLVAAVCSTGIGARSALGNIVSLFLLYSLQCSTTEW